MLAHQPSVPMPLPAPQLPLLTPLLEKLQKRSTFTAPEIDALLALPVRLVSINAGAYLVRDGDIPHQCCVLLSGSLFRHKVTRSGARQIVSIHYPGDLLGLDQALLNFADYNVQALTSADVGFISCQAVLELAAEFPAIGRALWRDVFVDASVTREWLVNLGRRDARQRIAHLICELAVRQAGAAVKDGHRVNWPLTQEQLGDAAGLTPIHVNRTLQAIRAAGLISTARYVLTILDWAGLRDTGDFNPAYLNLPVKSARDAKI